jgi:hypothetical protein
MAWEPIGIDGVFFISIGTLLTTFLGLAIKYCLKSKCEHLNLCCGLIQINRRVDLEEKLEERELELGIKEEIKDNSRV